MDTEALEALGAGSLHGSVTQYVDHTDVGLDMTMPQHGTQPKRRPKRPELLHRSKRLLSSGNDDARFTLWPRHRRLKCLCLHMSPHQHHQFRHNREAVR